MSERLFAQRRRSGRWQRWRRRVCLILIALLAGLLVWLIWFSTVLGVRHVDVEGVRTITAGEVTQRAAIERGEPLARVDTTAAEVRIAALARVESVELRRSWPNTVTIVIKERQSVAWIKVDGTIRGLDRFGVDFRDYDKAPKNLLEVRVEATDPMGRQAAMVESAKVVAGIRRGDDVLYRSIDHVTVGSKDSVALVLSRGRIVRWGSAAHEAKKLAVLKPLLAIKARTYDVSAPEQPTTRE